MVAEKTPFSFKSDLKRCRNYYLGNSRFHLHRRQHLSIKPLIFVSIFCCSYIIWSQIDQIEKICISLHNNLQHNSEDYHKDLAEETLINIEYDSRYSDVYRKKQHLPNRLKYILLWTSAYFQVFPSLGRGQKAFITNKCPVLNCYVTTNRSFFGGDLTKFDVIAFNGRSIGPLNKKDLPKVRAPHQNYIYFNSESATIYPVCKEFFDDYFNWTVTYRLDSDVVNPYFKIKNAKGEIVGPSNDMRWDLKDPSLFSLDNNIENLHNKTKAAAWFVSNCNTLSHREDFVEKLNKALKVYNLNIDIYGSCGDLNCPRYRHECEDMLKRDYFFYMSLESSFAKDYVTEKLLTAMQNDVIPIVWGGANYSKFLPPNSYIDGRKTTPRKLAAKMYYIMNSPNLYKKYFVWKKYYSYHETVFDVCGLCKALNDKSKSNVYNSYKNFREWWNTNTSYCENWIYRYFGSMLN